MRVISNRALTTFANEHPDASAPLQAWRRIIENSHFRHFTDLKWTFNSVDRVNEYYVFDISGNRYRLITRSTSTGRCCSFVTCSPTKPMNNGDHNYVEA